MSQSLPSRRLQPPHRSKSLAEVAELADAHGSGPCTRKGVGVRVPSSAPRLAHSQQHLGSRNAFLTFTNLLCRFYKFFMPSTISIVDGFYRIYGDLSWDLHH